MTTRGLAAGVLLCWSIAASAAAQAPPKKHALLVGLDKYLRSLSVPPLQFAQNDVKELKAVLEKRGFEVTMVVNSDASRGRVLSELYRLADVVEEKDDFLLYYAGHGVRNRFPSRKTFWLTYDAGPGAAGRHRHPAAAPARLRPGHQGEAEAHPAGSLLQRRRHRRTVGSGSRRSSRSRSAFSGPRRPAPGGPVAGGPSPAPGGAPRAATGPVGLQRGAFPVFEIHDQSKVRAEGLMIVTAARGGAFEVEALKHGIFTAALLKALDSTAADVNSDRRLSVDELTRYLDQETDRLALGVANAQQDVDVFGSVSNPQTWFVVDNLSDPAQEVDANFGLATDKLSNWEQKTWITATTKDRCWQALLDWKGKVKAGQQLAADEKELVDRTLKATLEGHPAQEQARADQLERFVSNLSTPP